MSTTFNIADLKKYYLSELDLLEHSRTNVAKEGSPNVAHMLDGASNCALDYARSTIRH